MQRSKSLRILYKKELTAVYKDAVLGDRENLLRVCQKKRLKRNDRPMPPTHYSVYVRMYDD